MRDPDACLTEVGQMTITPGPRSFSAKEFGLNVRDVEAGSIDLGINMRSLGMFSARRADIADRSYSWQNPNHSARILNVGEVRIMLVKEFNGHELLFRDILATTKKALGLCHKSNDARATHSSPRIRRQPTACPPRRLRTDLLNYERAARSWF